MDRRLLKKGLLVLFASLLVFSYSNLASAVSGRDLINDAKKTIKKISVEQAKKDIDAGKAIVVDVRSEKEYKRGHLPGAILLQRGFIEVKFANKFPNKNAYIITYCRSGDRSALSTQTLMKMGYKNVVSMDPGWLGWVKAGYPVE